MYDFDFERPNERKYSGGRIPRDSPQKDKPREITPLREMTAKLVPLGVTGTGDTTATDHTSDNDSSFSTTEDETTTDDQMMPAVRYNFNTPLGFFNQQGLRHPDSSSKVYDARNFQRNNGNLPGAGSDRPVLSSQPEIPDHIYSAVEPSDTANLNSASTVGASFQGESRDLNSPQLSESAIEGPMPQVPSLPKDLQRTARTSPPQDLPWPHSPPPPYSPDQKFTV